jgi:hypothetical protein
MNPNAEVSCIKTERELSETKHYQLVERGPICSSIEQQDIVHSTRTTTPKYAVGRRTETIPASALAAHRLTDVPRTPPMYRMCMPNAKQITLCCRRRRQQQQQQQQ